MQRKFLSSLFLLMLLNFLIKPFWLLGIDRSVQNAVGAESYGIYYALFNLAFLLDILLDFGITNFNNRDIARNHKLIGKNLIGIAYMKLGFALIYLLMSFSLGYFLGYRGPMLLLLLVLAFNKVLLSGILFLRSNISGLQLFKTDAVLSVMDRTLMIVICAFLLWGEHHFGKFQIEWLAYTQSFAYLITLIACLVIVLHRSKVLNWQPNLKELRGILKQSLPFALIILFMSIYYRIDAVMLERILPDGDYHAGIYAQGYRILDAFNMVGFLFVGILFPLFSKMIAKNENYRSILNLSTRLLLSFAVIASISSFIWGERIVKLLYTEVDLSSGNTFSMLMLCFIPISFVNIYGTLLTANGNLKAYNYIAFVGILINVGLNWWLIPEYQAFGSALASLLTNLLVAGLIFLVLVKKMDLAVDALLGLKLIGIGALILIVSYFMDMKTGLSWQGIFIAGLAVGTLGAFLLRIIGLASVKEFLSLKK